MKQLLIFWTPVFSWMGIIFILSSQQRVSVSETYAINFLVFKTLHIIEYAMLFLLTRRAIKYGTRARERNIHVYTFMIVAFYAATDELHQQFVPTREGTIRDVIIDLIGASMAWISIKHSSRILPKKLNALLHRWQIL